MPALPRWRMILSPWATSARLAPVSGTTSDRAERHEIEPLHQVGNFFSRLAQQLIHRYHQQERDADGRKLRVGSGFVEAVGVDLREGLRHLQVALMVVGDDDVQPR